MTVKEAKAIKRLKFNEDHIIFADMDEKDQEVLKKVGPVNCEYLTCEYEVDSITLQELNLSGIPVSDLYWNELGCSSKFLPVGIYRIRPDYQTEPPEPEYIERDVLVNSDGDLVVDCPDGLRRCIDNVTHREDFRDFHDISGPMCITDVAEKHSKGFHVVARFERK